jgi:hypothetical protein
MNLSKIKLTKKHIIIAVFVFIIFNVASFFLVNFLRIKNKQMVFRAHDIDSFAGCFGSGKESYKSYENMTEQEIEESLKKLDIAREEFEKIKEDCIKSQQLSSFAGCKGRKNAWKSWNEMSEQEFKKNLEYFGIDENKFNLRKKSCSE